MRKSVVLAAVALSACTTQQSSTKSYDAEMRAYIQCNLVSSKNFASQPGDPYSLALAAQGMCGREANAMAQAFAAMNGPGWASDLMNRLEYKQIRSNAAMIVRTRAGA